MSGPAATNSDSLTNELCGPDELVASVLATRANSEGEEAGFGDITDEGVRRLIRLAYFAGQAPNEGRYPRIRLLVPAKSARLEPDVVLDGEVTIPFIQRVAPVLGSFRQALVVRERDGQLHCAGVVSTIGALAELPLADPLLSQPGWTSGLYVELLAPGVIRVIEGFSHRIQSGRVLQEKSFTYDPWFEEWSRPATIEMFGNPEAATRTIPGWGLIPRYAVVAVWLRILNRAAELRHGACFAILPDPAAAAAASLRHVFRTTECDVGAALVACRMNPAPRWECTPRLAREVEAEHHQRLQAKQRLLSAVETVASLSATDGCVVLNRQLQLYSFGSMIEAAGLAGDAGLPHYKGRDSLKYL